MTDPTPKLPTQSSKRPGKTLGMFLGLSLALGALTGCPSEESGGMESVGEAMDEAAEDAKSAVEDAFDEDGPMEKAGEALDTAGENMEETYEEAKEDFKDASE